MHAVLISDFVLMLAQELLKLSYRLFCISAAHKRHLIFSFCFRLRRWVHCFCIETVKTGYPHMAFHTAVMYKLCSDERFLTPMEIFTIIEQERFNCAVFPKVSAQEMHCAGTCCSVCI